MLSKKDLAKLDGVMVKNYHCNALDLAVGFEAGVNYLNPEIERLKAIIINNAPCDYYEEANVLGDIVTVCSETIDFHHQYPEQFNHEYLAPEWVRAALEHFENSELEPEFEPVIKPNFWDLLHIDL
jgi:hypothetical protein